MLLLDVSQIVYGYNLKKKRLIATIFVNDIPQSTSWPQLFTFIPFQDTQNSDPVMTLCSKYKISWSASSLDVALTIQFL